jgi:hypothetical protein
MSKLVILIFVYVLIGCFFLISFGLSNDYFSEMTQQEKECLAGLYLSYIGCAYICQEGETEEMFDKCLTICENIMYENYLRCVNCCDENINNQK